MTDKTLMAQAVNDIDTMTMGKMLAQSGYFTDAKEAAQAVVKVMAGRELGIPPVASMTGIYVVKGKISLSANIMAALVKKSTRYNYRVLTPQADRARQCEIAFYERNGDKWEETGRSLFTAEDARRAGTQNMDKFPSNMLFARAMSNGFKWYCPDLGAGMPIYTPEELGAVVDGEGEVIEQASASVVIETKPETKPANGNGNSNGNGHGHKNGNGNGQAVLTLEQAKRAIQSVGLEWSEFVERQKATGLSGYDAARDTAAVQTFIAIIANQPGE